MNWKTVGNTLTTLPAKLVSMNVNAAACTPCKLNTTTWHVMASLRYIHTNIYVAAIHFNHYFHKDLKETLRQTHKIHIVHNKLYILPVI